jgi:predicted transcriptional regulator
MESGSISLHRQKKTTKLLGAYDMFVKQLLNEARKRLITIEINALLIDAATALSKPHIRLVVVCDAECKAVGVLTKADIVRRISHCEGATCRAAAAAAMTSELICCCPDDPLGEVWNKMKRHGLGNIPIIDTQSCPLGILNARDTLNALLTGATHETELLRDYVMSVGYH